MEMWEPLQELADAAMTVNQSKLQEPSNSDKSNLNSAQNTLKLPSDEKFATSKHYVDDPKKLQEIKSRQGVELSATFVCARAGNPPPVKDEVLAARGSKKVGCQFSLKMKVFQDDPDHVYVFEENGHTNHTPGDAEDAKYLKLEDWLVQRIEELYGYGLKACDIELQLQKDVNGSAPGSAPLNLTSLDRAAFKRRQTATLVDIQTIVKRLRQKTFLHDNDVQAVDKLVSLLRGMGCVVYYHPQEVVDGEVTQHFRLCIATPFGLRMLKAFGSELVFMDTCFGLNQLGYPQHTLLVQDDAGNGVPVAFCIADAENAEILEEFLAGVQKAADVNFTHVMIDKSKAEIAALTKLSINYLLCRFHMLQDVERFCKSGKSGIVGDVETKKRLRLSVYAHWRELADCDDEATFNSKCIVFKEWLLEEANGRTALPLLCDYFTNEWMPCAEHWAAFGRKKIKHLRANTNNLIERFFNTLKYTFASRRIFSRVEQHIKLLVVDVMHHYMYQRMKKVRGFQETRAAKEDRARARNVNNLVDAFDGIILNATDPISATVRSNSDQGTSYAVCLPEGSCQCYASEYGLSKHAEAAATKMPVTWELLESAAAEIIEMKEEEEEGVYFMEMLKGSAPEAGLYACRSLVVEGMHFTINILNGTCTCPCFCLNQVCPHLIAADRLPNISLERDHISAAKDKFCGGKPLNFKAPRRQETLKAEMEPLGDTYGTEFAEIMMLKESKAQRLESGQQEAVRECQHLKAVVRQLTATDAGTAATLIQELREELQQRIPQFKPTTMKDNAQDTRSFKRQLSHRVVRPLFTRSVPTDACLQQNATNEEVSALKATTTEIEPTTAGTSIKKTERRIQNKSKGIGAENQGKGVTKFKFHKVPPHGRPSTGTRGTDNYNRTAGSKRHNRASMRKRE